MIADPGHAWLEVPLSILASLGIEKRISDYSYVNEGMAYLEEDADFITFMAAAQRDSIIITIEEVHEDRTPIRGYRRYPG